jgi:glucose/arabinose dehydrogenase
VKVADAVGWPAGAMPVAGGGAEGPALRHGLDHPRWLYRLPNGDILVAETNAPPKPPEKSEGIKGFFQGCS